MTEYRGRDDEVPREGLFEEEVNHTKSRGKALPAEKKASTKVLRKKIQCQVQRTKTKPMRLQ